ncbi:hypothetical protein [Enterococcus faecalis]|uniref:hypothetical protein n=1 Tax=Enterococcus faecalis TaxID=1351 RepID=UPI003CC7FD92
MESLEQDIADIDNRIAQETTNYDKLNQLTTERQEKEILYETYFEEWDELSARME